MISKRYVALQGGFFILILTSLFLVEIVSTDDYMPMPIQTAEEFDKVLNVSWYNPEKPRDQQRYSLESMQTFLCSSRH